jgi:hypothetical protein
VDVWSSYGALAERARGALGAAGQRCRAAAAGGNVPDPFLGFLKNDFFFHVTSSRSRLDQRRRVAQLQLSEVHACVRRKVALLQLSYSCTDSELTSSKRGSES